MALHLQTDKQILERLGALFEEMRLQKGLQDSDVITNGGVTKDALNKFKKGENITSLNLIRIMRGIGVLDALEAVLRPIEDKPLFSPVSPDRSRKRIVKRAKKQMVWGDEQ